VDEYAAVEGREWFREVKRANQYLYAERWPSTGNGECDARIPKVLYGFKRLVLYLA
jgi:hypothetical protein